MLISGFTIIRNGLKYDFPFLESLKSALPVCDEFVICVGKSEDRTLEAIEEFKAGLAPEQASKIRIFTTIWPVVEKEKRSGGQILAEQTNFALEKCLGTWCLYLQADEVLHEDDLPQIRAAAEKLRDRPGVDALVFDYVHFYGTYDVIQTSRSSYRREIRVIRNGRGIHSTGDAQSFRGPGEEKLPAVRIPARVFHYGWVRPQEIMRAKTAFMDTLYHSDAKSDQPATGTNYLYKRFVGLKPFEATHPKVMADRVRNAPSFDFSKAPKVFHWKDTWKVVSGWIERLTGIRPFEFRNYKLIRTKIEK